MKDEKEDHRRLVQPFSVFQSPYLLSFILHPSSFILALSVSAAFAVVGALGGTGRLAFGAGPGARG
jgi:hypothetical protein